MVCRRAAEDYAVGYVGLDLEERGTDVLSATGGQGTNVRWFLLVGEPVFPRLGSDAPVPPLVHEYAGCTLHPLCQLHGTVVVREQDHLRLARQFR